MKRLVKVAIAMLVLSPSLILATHHKISSIDVDLPACGTYYKGYAWIFHSDHNIYYVWYHLEDDGSIKKEGSGSYEDCFSETQPASCVFKDKIYLFWIDRTGCKIWCVDFDGSHWGKKVYTGVSASSSSLPMGIGAAVADDKIYLFYQNGGSGYIESVYTSDGKNWHRGGPIVVEGKKFKTGSNVAVTACRSTKAEYWDLPPGKERLMIAWTSPDNSFSYALLYDPDPKSGGFVNLWELPSKYATGVALAAGSVDGGITGDRVQIFAAGKMDPWTYKVPYWRASIGLDFSQGAWEKVGSTTTTAPCYALPGALTNFKVFGDKGHNLRKEIWMLYLWHCIRWDSDQYVRVQDISQQLYDKDAYKKYWTMIGVVEGPPPYALNGRNPTSDSIADYSELSYATEADTGVSSTSTTSAELFVSVGGPGKYWPGIGISYTQGIEHKFCESRTHSTKLTHTFYPTTDTTKFLVYRYYLRPTMRRLKYEIRDWAGNSLDRYAYIFSISDYNLHVDVINMRDSLPYDPRIWDPATYQDRHIAADTSHYYIKAGRNINWVEGTKVELQISEEKGISSSQSVTKTIEIEVGMEGIFDIGVKGSVSSKHTVSTDSINTVTVMAHSPDPRGGHPEDIKSFSFYPYCLEPKDSVPYWIPKEFKHQRPWCITYEVTEIEYDETEIAAGLAEEKSLPSLKLYAISPNPSGSGVTIRYALPEEMRISLKVYDVNGRLIKVLADREQNSGVHSISWNGRDKAGREVANGVYFCKLSTEGSGKIRRIVLVR